MGATKMAGSKVVVLGCLCGLVGLGAGVALARVFCCPPSRAHEIRATYVDAVSGRLGYIQDQLAAASLLETLSEKGILAREDSVRIFLGEPDRELSVAELEEFIPNEGLRQEVLDELSSSVERARRAGAAVLPGLEDYRLLVYDEGEQFERPGGLKPRPYLINFYLLTVDRMVIYGGRLMRPEAFWKGSGSE